MTTNRDSWNEATEYLQLMTGDEQGLSIPSINILTFQEIETATSRLFFLSDAASSARQRENAEPQNNTLETELSQAL